MVFYLLTSLIFFFLTLNEFKNTVNLKQPSGHCYYRDFSETGPRYDHDTTEMLMTNSRAARYWPNFIRIRIAIDTYSHLHRYDQQIFFYLWEQCGQSQGDSEDTLLPFYTGQK